MRDIIRRVTDRLLLKAPQNANSRRHLYAHAVNDGNAGCNRSNVTRPRMAASLIGRLGQAHFPLFLWIIVTHPGHASLRSLVDAVMAPLHACVGLVVESLALGRASRCAAAIFGFFHRPRPVRDDPVRLSRGGGSGHAVPSTPAGRNSVPSAHILCSRTANFLATATTARRRPLVRTSRMPQDLI